MISHSDRARAWLAVHMRTRHAKYVHELAAEFERLLPEGGVAVDREKLRALIDTATRLRFNYGSAQSDREKVASAVYAINHGRPLGGDNV